MAATSVSASVVIFAPMMYGSVFARRMYPFATSGTSTVSDTDTDSVRMHTPQPSQNIAHATPTIRERRSRTIRRSENNRPNARIVSAVCRVENGSTLIRAPSARIGSVCSSASAAAP